LQKNCYYHTKVAVLPAVPIRGGENHRASMSTLHLCFDWRTSKPSFLNSDLILIWPSRNRHRVFLTLGEQKMDCRPDEPLRRACRAVKTDIKTSFMLLIAEDFLFYLFKISIISTPLLFPALRETSTFRYIPVSALSRLKYTAPIPPYHSP